MQVYQSLSVCSVENIPVTSYNWEDIGLESMKVYRGLSVVLVWRLWKRLQEEERDGKAEES